MTSPYTYHKLFEVRTPANWSLYPHRKCVGTKRTATVTVLHFCRKILHRDLHLEIVGCSVSPHATNQSSEEVLAKAHCMFLKSLKSISSTVNLKSRRLFPAHSTAAGPSSATHRLSGEINMAHRSHALIYIYIYIYIYKVFNGLGRFTGTLR